MKKMALLLLVLVMLLSGCGGKHLASVQYAADDISYSAMREYDAAETSDYSNAMSANVPKAANGTPLPQNRKWIITMNLSTETEDLDAALTAVSEKITALNGYIESQNIYNTASYRKNRSASMTVRIPADQVDAFVAEVSGIANVISNSRSVKDITLAYTDTEGRLTALKTEEQRLLELMEQAENMSDLLEIESRLTDVRYELERHASQLRLYDNQVDYATVDLSISEVQKYTPVEEPGFWKRITEGLSESIVDLGAAILDAIAWFIIDLPYLIILSLLAWFGIRLIKRSWKKRKSKKEDGK